MKVIGLDACRGGWVVVTVTNGRIADINTTSDLRATLESKPDVEVAGIDIPIGLPETDQRQADKSARIFVGPRWQSVFMTPPREALEAATHAEGTAACKRLTRSGMSQQAYALGTKILEVEALVERFPLHEVHPEVSFCALAGRHLENSKKSWNGFIERMKILAAAGLEPPLEYVSRRDAAIDDVLDAVAAAWSAMRVARGDARTLPESHDKAATAGQVIWY